MAQGDDVEGIVLHLENNAVVGRRADGQGRLPISELVKVTKAGAPFSEGADGTVQTRRIDQRGSSVLKGKKTPVFSRASPRWHASEG